jgi:hypothetical protein
MDKEKNFCARIEINKDNYIIIILFLLNKKYILIPGGKK